MKVTIPGVDVITVREGTIDAYKTEYKNKKVHLIRLDFENPTEDKIDDVLANFPETNRFIVDENIKFYNSYLKNTSKKYYVKNRKGTNLISFFRKNNKILMDFVILSDEEFDFAIASLQDLLRNVEVILLKKETFRSYEDVLKFWKGNVIIYDENYYI